MKILAVKDVFRAYSNPRSRTACDVLEHTLTLPGLDPGLIPRINRLLKAGK